MYDCVEQGPPDLGHILRMVLEFLCVLFSNVMSHVCFVACVYERIRQTSRILTMGPVSPFVAEIESFKAAYE